MKQESKGTFALPQENNTGMQTRIPGLHYALKVLQGAGGAVHVHRGKRLDVLGNALQYKFVWGSQMEFIPV